MAWRWQALTEGQARRGPRDAADKAGAGDVEARPAASQRYCTSGGLILASRITSAHFCIFCFDARGELSG